MTADTEEMMLYKLTALLKICGSFVRLSISPPARIELLCTGIGHGRLLL